MKTKLKDCVLVAAFLGFLCCMLAAYLLLPKQDFSEKEKKYLPKLPAVTAENWFSAEFGAAAEDYLAQHIPGRDLYVGMASYYDLISGRQGTKEIYLAAGDRLVESPAVWDEARVQINLQRIESFAQKTQHQVDLMIVPSAGYALGGQLLHAGNAYKDDEIIGDIYELAGENVACRDITDVMASAELYYRTDHHWTSQGAYKTYAAYMQMLGREVMPESAFTKQTVEGFYGTTYSRSGLWLVPSESLELWQSNTALSVLTDSNTPHLGVFYPERLQELDKYTVYLDGNQSLVRIDNPEKLGSGKLLVIRDSYANCLGGFLAESYESVVMVDLRYYKKAVSDLLAQEDFTDVLVCYSIKNFLTDKNLVFLN